MTPVETAEYAAVAGDMLAELGYELGSEAGHARAADQGVTAPVGA
jgi:hypothetical protein